MSKHLVSKEAIEKKFDEWFNKKYSEEKLYGDTPKKKFPRVKRRVIYYKDFVDCSDNDRVTDAKYQRWEKLHRVARSMSVKYYSMFRSRHEWIEVVDSILWEVIYHYDDSAPDRKILNRFRNIMGEATLMHPKGVRGDVTLVDSHSEEKTEAIDFEFDASRHDACEDDHLQHRARHQLAYSEKITVRDLKEIRSYAECSDSEMCSILSTMTLSPAQRRSVLTVMGGLETSLRCPINDYTKRRLIKHLQMLYAIDKKELTYGLRKSIENMGSGRGKKKTERRS